MKKVFIVAVLTMCTTIQGFTQDLEVRHNVPCPWVMEKQDKQTLETKVKEYIVKLGSIINSKEVGTFKDALLARAHEDSLEVARLKPYIGPMNEAQMRSFHELEAELERFDYFLNTLVNETVRYSFTGKTSIEGKQVVCNFESASYNAVQRYVYVKHDIKDNKAYFYESNGDKTFLEPEDLDLVLLDTRRFFYVYYLLSGQKDQDFIKDSYTAQQCWLKGLEARDNNKPENITRYPYPKGGALNSYSSAALATAKTNETYKEGIACVIEEDSWIIDRDGFGNIIRRRVGAWIISNTKYGKFARRCQVAQDYQGGSYGSMKLYGIGGGHFYIQ